MHQKEKLFVYIEVEQDLQKLFKQAKYQPAGRLSGDIWASIELKNAQIAKWKKYSYMSLSVLSLFGSAFSIKSLIIQSTQLGFFEYLSLTFSDSGIIAKYWKEYTLSLADSLPVASLAITLFLLFVLFVSIKRVSIQFKTKLLTV